MIGFRVVGVKDTSYRTSCQLLVITVEHMDNLLMEWFPKIDQFTNFQGIKAVRRVSFCNMCLLDTLKKTEKKQNPVSQEMDIKKNVCGNFVLETGETERNVYTPDEEKMRTMSVDSIEDEEETASEEQDKDDEKEQDEDGSIKSGEEPTEDDYLDDDEFQLMEEYRQRAKGCIVAFELEEASKLLREKNDLLCPFHYKVDFSNIFPDLVGKQILPNDLSIL